MFIYEEVFDNLHVQETICAWWSIPDNNGQANKARRLIKELLPEKYTYKEPRKEKGQSKKDHPERRS